MSGEGKGVGRRGYGRGRGRGLELRTPGDGDMPTRARGRRVEPSEHSGSITPPEEGSPKGSPERDASKRVQFIELATRPGNGTAGKKIAVLVNHFELVVPKNLTITQYYVDVSHERIKMNRDEKRQVFWQCVDINHPIFGPVHGIAYDGDHICISSKLLKFPSNHTSPGSFEFEISYRLLRMDRKEPMKIRFQLVGPVEINLSQVRVAEPNERFTTPLNILDILFRQNRTYPKNEMSKSWYPFGPTVYRVPPDPRDVTDLGCGQAIWQGLFNSTRIGDDFKPLINFDVVHSSFYQGMPVLDFMMQVLNHHFRHRGPFRIDQLSESTELESSFVQALSKELKGVKIWMEVRPVGKDPYDKQYTISGVMPTNAVNQTFEKKEDDTTRQVSVVDYFAERNVRLRYPYLNVLSARSKKGCYLPMERCTILSNQRVMKKLSSEQTSIMIKAAAISAPGRQQKIMQLVSSSGFSQDPWLQQLGIRVVQEMKRVDGRILTPPKIRYGAPDGGAGNTVLVKEGVWDGRMQRFFLPATLVKPGAIIIDDAQDMNVYGHFFSFILKTCSESGMRVPPVIQSSDVRVILPTRCSDEIEQRLSELKGNGCELVFVSLPQKGSVLYAIVKQAAEITCGIMTQCVCKITITKTMQRRDRATAANIALKVNTKMGGVNWRSEADEMGQKTLSEKTTLLLGIDVTHPAPTEQRTPSIATMVGNLDDNFMRYAASVRIQKHRRESIVSLRDLARDRLVDFHRYRSEQNEIAKKEGKLTKIETKPQRIIIFRDGVAESQFQEVLSNELKDVRQACESLESGYKPAITLIVAQKRHHTRFFPASQDGSCGRSSNIFPGTVVDRGITHPQLFEFYLCSHLGIQGTSRPIRYHVLADDNKFSADQLQSLAFALSHNFARCPRAVSLPAPLYYADLACRRARAHLFEKIADFSTETMSQAGTGGAGTGPAASGGTVSTTAVSEGELISGSSVTPNMKLTMYFT